ncbi:hypothetical protein NQ317_009536 [Molorchus minor]|uniref:Uncharacterized protein n=1 Tax=Molorchus minor TaxID=1323400 RepID=A0ABQ9IRL3_9CUCU|nr:hypothetical protein NQ317_009536 [Molorchus minor]
MIPLRYCWLWITTSRVGEGLYGTQILAKFRNEGLKVGHQIAAAICPYCFQEPQSTKKTSFQALNAAQHSIGPFGRDRRREHVANGNSGYARSAKMANLCEPCYGPLKLVEDYESQANNEA